jgi:outer membrane protein OmpA-like peptidoglycan-associated protein
MCRTFLKFGGHSMKLRNILWAALASVLVMACAQVAPAPKFSAELGKQYNHLADARGRPMYEWYKADHFRDKSKQALNGKDVQPENPQTWNVPDEYMPEFKNAYSMLQIALVPDKKKVTDPVNAADAQAYFDCWTEQAHRHWTPTSPTSDCRAAFYNAICRMYPGHCHKPAKDHIFRIYFPTGSAAINKAGAKAVRQAVSAFKAGGAEVIVAGHADRVGSSDTNLELSKKRAAVVKAALVAHGVPGSKINGKYFGEEQPLVQTPDNVPNANNRRVLIVVR